MNMKWVEGRGIPKPDPTSDLILLAVQEKKKPPKFREMIRPSRGGSSVEGEKERSGSKTLLGGEENPLASSSSSSSSSSSLSSISTSSGSPIDKLKKIAKKTGQMDISLSRSSFIRCFCVLANHRLYCFSLDGKTCITVLVLDKGAKVVSKKKNQLLWTFDKNKASFADRSQQIGPWGEPLPYVPGSKVHMKACAMTAEPWLKALNAEIENPEPFVVLSGSAPTTMQVPAFWEDEGDEDEKGEEEEEEDLDDGSSFSDNESGWLYLYEKEHWNKYYFRLSLEWGLLCYLKTDKVNESRLDKDIVGMIAYPGCVINQVNEAESHKRDFAFEIFSPDKRRIFPSLLPGTQHKVASSHLHAHASRAILAASSAEECNRWVSILSKVVRLNATSAVQIPNVGPEVPRHDVEFLNLFLDRLFRDMCDSKLFFNDIYTSLVTGLSGINTPDFVAPIRLENMGLGDSFIRAHGVRLTGTNLSNEMVGEIDLEYCGGSGIDLATGLYLNWPRDKAQLIPVKAKVRIQQVAGKAQLYAAKEPQCRWWFFFAEEPNISISINITVGQGGVKSNLTSLPQLRNFIQSVAKNAIISAFVWPSKITLNIPIPGKKLEPKVEVASCNARIDQDSSSAPPRPPPNPSTRLSTDAAANAFLLKRFFDLILSDSHPLYSVHLPEIYADYCQIIGTHPFYDRPLKGYEGAKHFANSFRQGFPDVKFEIIDIQCETSNVMVQFRASGTHMGHWWGAPPTTEKCCILGFVSSRVTYAKIVSQMWFWAPESILLFA